eukprot:gb/GECG01016004.1/.p1 GENE.gb/GECG01016004.1/~~gb/GECG01016004.1/.p1  ORF type:complete len:110 (+),score=10.32 gb/GECG01016004.1/:1-330(+)
MCCDGYRVFLCICKPAPDDALWLTEEQENGRMVQSAGGLFVTSVTVCVWTPLEQLVVYEQHMKAKEFSWSYLKVKAGGRVSTSPENHTDRRLAVQCLKTTGMSLSQVVF